MKIAIALSGFLRTWEFTRDNFEWFFEGHDIDIYAHVYRQNYHEQTTGTSDVIYTDDEIASFFKGLNVVSLVIEDVNETRPIVKKMAEEYRSISNFNNEIRESSDAHSSTISIGERLIDQYRTLSITSNNIKNSGKKYDLIVKSRYDVRYLEYVTDFSDMCDGKLHFETGATSGYPCEIVVIGIPSVMSPIMDRFDYLRTLYLPSEDELKSCLGKNNHHNCGQILPACAFCSHTSFSHLASYLGIEFGTSSCICIVMRAEKYVHCAMLLDGTSPLDLIFKQ